MKPPKMIRTKGDGIEIQFAEWPGEGQTVFCLHGLTANCRSFDAIAAGISPPHRVLAMDLRGRGLSDKPASGYSLDHHCRDLEAAARDLGVNSFYLMGHSLGAYVALAYAAGHPEQVKGIILVDGGAARTLEQWAKISAGIQPSVDRLGKDFPSFDAYVELIRKAPFMQPWNQTADDYFKYESEETPDGKIRSRINPANINEERGNLLTMDAAQYYPLIKSPVLILRAVQGMVMEDDLVLPREAMPAMRAALPQARVVDLPGINHYTIAFHSSEPRDQAILDFLG
ncbi:MAG: alpha/beta hydrolase [Pseudomonadota bacterium]